MGATAGPALEISGLSKAYRIGHIRPRRRPVLRDLTLGVERGEIFGYLGPNGSGKTTTLKIVIGLLQADAGQVRVLGAPLGDRAWRYRVGYLPEQPYLYDYLTAQEYLEYVGRLFGMPPRERRDRSRELLKLVGLERAAGQPLRRASKGMLQRAGLAQALMNRPELVFLDEPMSGLDPLGRRLVSRIILDLRRGGSTVVFSTHILSDAESLCDRVGLLREGRLVAAGRIDQLLPIDISHLEVVVSGIGGPTLDRLSEAVRSRRAAGERWTLEVAEGTLGRVVQDVEAAGGRVLSVHPVRQSLEEYFVQQMGGMQPEADWAAD